MRRGGQRLEPIPRGDLPSQDDISFLPISTQPDGHCVRIGSKPSVIAVGMSSFSNTTMHIA